MSAAIQFEIAQCMRVAHWVAGEKNACAGKLGRILMIDLGCGYN